MSPLDRKLLRDLWRMRLQASAIALVVGVGVLLLIMMSGLVSSLEDTRTAYYDRYRFADVFAPVKRAPYRALDQIRDIEGVAAVEARVVGGALIDLDGQVAPIRAQAVSLPDLREPRLNWIYLSAGAHIDPRRRNDILLLEGFANAHGLGPGDEISATMNGGRRTFRIAGLAQAPEFLYSTAPGELVPDDSRFAVIWMSEDALAHAFDVDGAFNEALIALDRGAEEAQVIADLDRILEPYGGLGAYGREDHFSDRFISEEITSLRASGAVVPPIFMAVAAFLLYIVISRLVDTERTQIGLLKAFGYTNIEVSAYYLKFVLSIAVTGALIGCVFGVWAGHALAAYYQLYYKFPFLLFRIDNATFVIAIIVSIVAASAGGLMVLRRVFNLAPAEAMRPPAPADYSRSANLVRALRRYLDQPSRMIVRRLARQPARAAAAIIGVAAGMGLSVATLGVMGGFERAANLAFTVIDRSDATVTFVEPLGEQTIYELQRLPGVIEVEPYRAVSVIFQNGVRKHRGAILGMEGAPRLFRALTDKAQPIAMREEGLIIAEAIARKLDVEPGGNLTVDVREGRRPMLNVPVAGTTRAMLGAPVYMELSALNELMDEPGRVSGAYLRIDMKQGDAIYQRLKEMPAVAGVGLRSEAREAFQDLMNSGAGATRYIMAVISGIITFGIVYNSARIAFAERAHDLASLRVIGFTKGETAFVLLGELGAIILVAVPMGILLGQALAGAMAAGFSTDLYTVPSDIGPGAIGGAALAVFIASVVSGLLVKRDIDRLDMVSALKSRV